MNISYNNLAYSFLSIVSCINSFLQGIINWMNSEQFPPKCEQNESLEKRFFFTEIVIACITSD